MGIHGISLLFPGDDLEKLVVTSLPDGKFSVSGPDSVVSVVDTAFYIDSPQVTDHGDGTFTVSSE